MTNLSGSTHLCLVISSLEAGGAERVMARLANAWSGRFKVTLVTLSGDTPDHYRLDPTVRRRRLALAASSASIWSAISNNWKSLRVLRTTMRELRPDAIVSFIDRTNSLVLFATLGLGIPVVVSERVDPRMHSIPRKARVLRRLMYPRSAALVVQTNTVKRWATRIVSKKRIHVIPNPVSVEGIVPRHRTETIVGMGRLVDQKGFDLLVRAFAMLPASMHQWRLRIVGEGECRAYLENLTRSLGIVDRVELPGITPTPMKELAMAGMFVLSSRYEGFPNVLLESMACGTPSIAFNCPSGPNEIIHDGLDGLLVRPENVEALRDAIVRLIEDPAMRARLGAEAQMAVGRFSSEGVLAMWDDVINAVI